MFLTREEIIQLTGKRMAPAQVRALKHMGIEHRVRPDGTVAVLESHVQKLLGGLPPNSVKEKVHEPNWNAIR